MESLATSKLIGSDNEDEETIARQMATRLTHRLGMSVMISCSLLANNSGDGGSSNSLCMLAQGVDMDMLQHKAAALAEREVYRILRAKLSEGEAAAAKS